MGKKTVGFRHGALAPRYEEQANEQGFTLGEQAELFDDIAHAYNTLRLEGYLTDKQEDAICKKIQKNLVKNLTPLPKESK